MRGFVAYSPALRAWGAALAALVLLLQGLIPAAAIAHNHGADQVQICTARGVKLISLHAEGVSHHHFGGLACEQCVMASFTAVAAVPPATKPPTAWTYQAPLLAAGAASSGA